jgi:hypothetical protein
MIVCNKHIVKTLLCFDANKEVIYRIATNCSRIFATILFIIITLYNLYLLIYCMCIWYKKYIIPKKQTKNYGPSTSIFGRKISFLFKNMRLTVLRQGFAIYDIGAMRCVRMWAYRWLYVPLRLTFKNSTWW